jgi:hypothetical protein
MEEERALVLFGGVVNSRKDRQGSAAWLRGLTAELDEAYGERRIAPFGFTQGDELQGLLAPEADPMDAILRAALAPEARPVRWVAVKGCVDPGEGPATQRSGQAFLVARKAIEAARSSHERLVLMTGRADVDALLNDMTPALVEMLDTLTTRQRSVARLALIEGLRQSDVADRLGVRRATISVSFGRAGVPSVGRLVAAIRRVYSSAAAASSQPPAPTPAPASPGDARVGADS